MIEIQIIKTQYFSCCLLHFINSYLGIYLKTKKTTTTKNSKTNKQTRQNKKEKEKEEGKKKGL